MTHALWTPRMPHDANIAQLLYEHCDGYEIDPLDSIKLFPVLARRQWLKRFLAHAELFKLTIDVPGDIAELGVYRGAGLFTWANLLEAYCIGDRTKVVYGFDNWQGFTELSPQDGIPEGDKVVGGFNPARYKNELQSAVEIFDADRFANWKPRIQLVEGPIEQTVRDFVDLHTGCRFSLVHFDCDLYAPTKAALEAIWPRVASGGVVLFDEYAMKEWPGETQAVDEFFADKNVQLRKLTWNNTPGAYVVKG